MAMLYVGLSLKDIKPCILTIYSELEESIPNRATRLILYAYHNNSGEAPNMDRIKIKFIIDLA